MSETLIMLLVVAGGILTVQNAFVGFRAGKIEMRSVVFDRAEQPTAFWFVLVTEIIFIGAMIWIVVGWLTGAFTFEANQ